MAGPRLVRMPPQGVRPDGGLLDRGGVTFDADAYLLGGAIGDRAAIQAAIDAASAVGGGRVRLSSGRNYAIDAAGLTISGHRVRLVAPGKHGATLTFAPTAHDQSCITVSGGVGVLYQAGIEGGVTITSADTAFRKVALRLVDTSEFDVDGLTVGPTGLWTDVAHGSIGIQLRGRELTTVRRVSISADTPIKVEANPNFALIACDHFHLVDSYLIAAGTAPCLHIDPSAPVTNLTIDGTNAWIGGGFGIYWDDASGTYHQGCRLSGIRWEQSTNATGYAVYITAAVRGLQLDNIWCGNGLDHRGIYLRRAKDVRITNGGYAGTGEALNVDGLEQCWRCEHFIQAGATVSLGAMEEVWASSMLHGNQIPTTAYYRDPASDPVPGMRLYGQQQWAHSANIASAGRINLPWSGSLAFGRLSIEVHSATYFAAADVLIRSAAGGAAKIVAQTADGLFSEVFGGAVPHVYVWIEGGTIHIDNYLGEAADVRLSLRFS